MLNSKPHVVVHARAPSPLKRRGRQPAHGGGHRFPWAAAWTSALAGGLPGAAAMALQILLFCWLRTISHFQQVKGGTLAEAGLALWAQGVAAGYTFPLLRFYQGVLPALLQGPLCRFGDTAANEGVLVLLAGAKGMPLWLKTAVGTFAACSWRAALTPLDTLKLVLEVDGFSEGWGLLCGRIADQGLTTLFNGALGVGITAAVSHWPWFTVNNVLQRRLPPPHSRPQQLWRSAVIGFVATLCSDVVANPMRVLKATVQTSVTPMSYMAAARGVMAKDGSTALLMRGLTAKICANALQGIVFSVLWQLLMEAYAAREGPAKGRVSHPSLVGACPSPEGVDVEAGAKQL